MARTGPNPLQPWDSIASPGLRERLDDADVHKIGRLTIFCANLLNKRPPNGLMLWRSGRLVIHQTRSRQPENRAHFGGTWLAFHAVEASRGAGGHGAGRREAVERGLATMVRASSAKRPALSLMPALSQGTVATRAIGLGSATVFACTRSIKVPERRCARRQWRAGHAVRENSRSTRLRVGCGDADPLIPFMNFLFCSPAPVR
jgi:hypothetical protein